jgi:hypothetical protein
MALPDRIIDHNSQPKQYEDARLDAPRIVATALTALGQDGVAQQVRIASRNPSRARTN